MGKIYGVHSLELRPGVTREDLERFLDSAETARVGRPSPRAGCPLHGLSRAHRLGRAQPSPGPPMSEGVAKMEI